jgi:hypothetical protein
MQELNYLAAGTRRSNIDAWDVGNVLGCEWLGSRALVLMTLYLLFAGGLDVLAVANT